MVLQRLMTRHTTYNVFFWDLTTPPTPGREVEIAILDVLAQTNGSVGRIKRYKVDCSWRSLQAAPGWQSYDAAARATPLAANDYSRPAHFPHPGLAEDLVVSQVCGSGPASLTATARSLSEAFQIGDASTSAMPPPIPAPRREPQGGFAEVTWPTELGLVDEDEAGALFLDWAKIGRNGATARARTVTALKASTPGESPTVLMRMSEYDCKARTVTTPISLGWSHSGRLVFQDEAPAARSQTPAAGQLLARELSAVCEGSAPKRRFKTIAAALADLQARASRPLSSR